MICAKQINKQTIKQNKNNNNKKKTLGIFIIIIIIIIKIIIIVTKSFIDNKANYKTLFTFNFT